MRGSRVFFFASILPQMKLTTTNSIHCRNNEQLCHPSFQHLLFHEFSWMRLLWPASYTATCYRFPKHKTCPENKIGKHSLNKVHTSNTHLTQIYHQIATKTVNYLCWFSEDAQPTEKRNTTHLIKPLSQSDCHRLSENIPGAVNSSWWARVSEASNASVRLQDISVC